MPKFSYVIIIYIIPDGHSGKQIQIISYFDDESIMEGYVKSAIERFKQNGYADEVEPFGKDACKIIELFNPERNSWVLLEEHYVGDINPKTY